MESTTKELIGYLDSLYTNLKFNPTIIYNEGWMVRLLVRQSIKEELKLMDENNEVIINFGTCKGKEWSSEALISSPFVNKGNKKETHTHADIIWGDFEVDYTVSGKIIVNQDSAKILGIIEAKMGSPLSKGTKNAPNYNQASRNICCLAYTVPTDCKIFFIVVAPERYIDKIKPQIERTKIVKPQIEKRFKESHTNDDKKIIEKVDNNEYTTISAISYEKWIKQLKQKDEAEALNKFYAKCKKYNKIKES